jgi:ADP-ribosylglycohydrolase
MCSNWVFDFNDLDKLIQDSIDISQITHYDPRCTFSNVALNYLISKNMQRPNNVEPKRYIEDLNDIYNLILPYSPSLAELIAKIHKKILKFSEGTSSFDGIASEFYDKGGYVLDTLAISLISFYCTTSYKDALIETVNFGGDSDTNGAVLGALAGSYYGLTHCLKNALNLKKLDYLAEICKKFYEVINFKKIS